MIDRPEGLRSWHADWSGLRVVVLGSGVSGFAVADTLAELGATVLLASPAIDEATREVLGVIGVAALVTDLDGEVPEAIASFGAELLIPSPGFPAHHPLIAWAERSGTPVWSEVELAWRLRDKIGEPAPWIAVTGTNGKTTTVQLTAAMLQRMGLRVAPCGNIGVPVLDAVRDPQGFDVFVVELSSFQLEHTHSLAAHAAAVLNVADDHLDWHGGAEHYRAAKAKVYENAVLACVYNGDDPVTEHMVEEAEVVEGARAIGFRTGVPGMSELGIVEDVLVDRAFLEERRDSALEIATLAEAAQWGFAAPHQVQNLLASTALARALGASIEAIRAALSDFEPDRHRTELIAEHRGVRFVDDSKATNPHAAAAALRAYDSVVWIVGGLFKGSRVDELLIAHRARLRAAVLIGVDRAELRAAFARHAPAIPVFEVAASETGEVMPTAVSWAVGQAEPGDVVLLAPSAASMDQFRDYADRGERFRAAVAEAIAASGASDTRRQEGGSDDDQPTAHPSGA